MSPEQFRLGRSAIDARSDVWSLGVVLIEMLIGRLPFSDDPLEVVRRKIDNGSLEELLRPPDVSGPVNQVCARAVARNRVERYETAADFANALALLRPHSTTLVSNSRNSSSRFESLKLPFPSTSFVGRANELRQLKTLLESRRMLTIVGPGGAGKTRLAIELASQVSAQSHLGICYVALAGVEQGGDVASALADALQLPPNAKSDIVQQAVDYVGGEDILLVFDNCEHVLIQVADVARRMLKDCLGLKVLATSREQVGVDGEQAFRVRSLDMTADTSLEDGALINLPDAVQLFTERARLRDPSFRVDASNQNLVVRVCELVDGIPLAIELAAARTGAVPLDAFVAHLEQELLLAMEGRGAVPSDLGASLAGSLEWSLQLLREEERELLAALTVFRGGWTHDAAGQVCLESEDQLATLSQLESLVNKSLVDLRLHSRHARYSLVEYVRQAMQIRLGESQAATLRRRHCLYFSRLAREAEPAYFSEHQPEWFQKLNNDIDNLRSAIEWSLSSACDPQASLSLAGDLGYFWYLRGGLSEGLRHLEKALDRDRSQQPTLERIKALTNAGWIAYRLGKFDRAHQLRTEGLNLALAIDFQQGVANGYNTLGLIAQEQGHLVESRDLHQKSLAIRQQIDHQWGVASSTSNLARVSAIEGNEEDAIRLMVEAIGQFRELGDEFCMAGCLIDLSWLQLIGKCFDQSMDAFEQAVQIALNHEFREMAVGSIEAGAGIAYHLGLVEVAATGFHTAAIQRAELGLPCSVLERERIKGLEREPEEMLPDLSQHKSFGGSKSSNLWHVLRDVRESVGAHAP